MAIKAEQQWSLVPLNDAYARGFRDAQLEAAELARQNEQPDFSNTFANINDTCRARGFEAGPSGHSTEDRVIALAQAYDALQAEVNTWQTKALDAGNHPAVKVLLEERDEARAQLAERQKFKDWVHNYLDTHGVPHHPPGTHGEHGCRIGDRMDWLMAQLAAAKGEPPTTTE
jgi:hypothetical protein